MKSTDNSWSLFRLSDRKQFDNVSLATIDFFFRALPEKVRPDWLMWREGFSGWRPFSELPQILKHLQKDQKDASTPPPVPESVLKFADEVTGVRHEVAVETHDALPEELPDVEDVTDSQIIEFKSPHAEPVAQLESDTAVDMIGEDEPLAKTHSSVSVRAIAAATSSLRLKTATGVPHLAPTPGNSQSVAPTKVSPRMQKPLESSKEMNVLTNENEATLSLMLESQAASEDRNNVRYQKKFKVRIYTPQGVLAVVTTDCSTSGFRLKEPLPAGLPRFFHVELDLGPEGKIPLVCSEIREKDGRGATRVRIQVNDHMNTLKSALVRAA